ncbi:MAG: PASTA domain-containing protein [Dysgonamonadaceae bacterium]|jgi:beta-lactam-binding protein with PASTA domain|nr:PASTA domain-containing protein [Dysgonamonadaceae bacterium]
MNTSFKSILSNIYVKNLLAAFAILCLLCFFTMKWIESYTRHGEYVEIPNVKGLTVEKAETVFANSNLTYQVIDSAFYKNLLPGGIIETIPSAGSKVKKGRTVFLRINSVDAQLTALPEVKDMSQRQAYAILRSLGFEKIETRFVPGQFRDLVTGLESRGQTVNPGEKVPLDIPLSLLVSSGSGEPDMTDIINDSTVNTEHGDGENWY